ncbi:tetratricopeptide repeat protein [Mucilaginibacter arboris]|uniref:Tetratricopeptide repeat protein n=1 Tax=Mucilaginibacter arboris TaxID=2682090 RepID=A0A7K1SV38_9SPHI|nr:hypothetical protein [Mucilaginibacter arboris]MVN20900.1 hypothetical protein [Mucilaginibacter arboris]
MKYRFILGFLIFSSFETIQAQNSYVKLGQKALMDGDFKNAVSILEKACIIDSTNANALWMLGYSYYHCDSYKKSIIAYTKVITVKPADATAYYYRARAKGHLANDNLVTAADKEKYFLGSILDFTKAASLNPSDLKNYQNRGIAYKDYGMFKLIKNTGFYDKNRAANAFRASIADLQKVLDSDPSRLDITSLLDLSKEQLAHMNRK